MSDDWPLVTPNDVTRVKWLKQHNNNVYSCLCRVGVPHAESLSIIMDTLFDSFQSYGATRSRSPVPQAAEPLASATALLSLLSGLSHPFVSRPSTKIRLLNQNPFFHASTNTTFPRKSYVVSALQNFPCSDPRDHCTGEPTQISRNMSPQTRGYGSKG